MSLRVQDIHTFFVVARSGAMKEAAKLLNVTPGAVSQRVRSIEDRCGKRLFERDRTGVRLTRAGKAFWRDIEGAFEAIEAAARRHAAPAAPNLIRISTVASFAASWLIPRLARFHDAHPAIAVEMEAEDRLVDLRREPVDLALRHGLGTYRGLKSEWIAAPEMILVASPRLLSAHAPILEPRDCLRFPLLRGRTQEDWRLWLEALGIDASGARYRSTYSDGFLLVRAAAEGQGLALVSDLYAADELAKGTLVKPLDIEWPSAFAYYAVALPATFARPAVRKLIEWLAAGASEGFTDGPKPVAGKRKPNW